MAHAAASTSLDIAHDSQQPVLGPPRSEARRGRRRRSIRVARANRRDREDALLRALDLEQEAPRPRTRAQCAEGARPCPYVACRHHLYLEVSPETGTIKLNFPELEVWELHHTCALDVAEGGEHELAATGRLLNLTRERIRQIEAAALRKLGIVASARELDSLISPAR